MVDDMVHLLQIFTFIYTHHGLKLASRSYSVSTQTDEAGTPKADVLVRLSSVVWHLMDSSTHLFKLGIENNEYSEIHLRGLLYI
jgi:hypothetical protein